MMKPHRKYLQRTRMARSASTCRARQSGQTLVELMAMIFGITGAFIGGGWGVPRGALWAVVGAIGGFFAGFAINMLLWMAMVGFILLFDSEARAEIAQERATAKAEAKTKDSEVQGDE